MEYLAELYKSVPNLVYEGLISIFCIGSVFFIAMLGWNRGWRKVVCLILVEYIILIFSTTVVFRNQRDTWGHEFRPFMSYVAINAGDGQYLKETIMNVIVFVPVGILLGLAFRSMTLWKVLLIGVAISSSIEAMQFFFKRGFAETDDVMHNTLGCMLGYGFCRLLMLALRYAK